MTKSLFDEGLMVEFESELGGKLAIEDVVYDSEPPNPITWMDVVFNPQFTEVSTKDGVLPEVLSLYDLWMSIQQPGAYHLIGCSCGSDHAGSDSPVYVSFPDEHTIVWELCGKGLSKAIEETWHGYGFLRLVFKREQYQSAVIDMIQQLRKHIASNDCDIDIAPDRCEGNGAEFFQTLDLSKKIAFNPRFEPNTLIEIGIFDDEMHRVNQQKSDDWLERYFSHWAVTQAFDEWMAFYRRGHVFNPTSMFYRYQDYMFSGELEIEEISLQPQVNHFYLVRAEGRDFVHAAGERFAKLLQLAINEGGYGENVQVVYRPVERPAVYV